MTEIIRIPDIDKYISEIINNELILTPKIKYLTENELKSTSLSKSVVVNCSIKDINGDEISNKVKYSSIVIDIWKSMSTSKILQNTTFNFKLTNENGKSGYTWCSSINMSLQRKDSNGTMREIIKMLEVNNYIIDICIKLENDKIIYYKNY
jgi:hypothetical protein